MADDLNANSASVPADSSVPSPSPVVIPPPNDPATVADQVVANTVVQAAQNTPAEPVGSSRRPELARPSAPVVEHAAGPTAEVEPAHELEPEVEKVEQMLEKKEINPPTETVVRSETQPSKLPKTVAQPVVVLPLSEQEFDQARKKNPQNSVQWLYQFCVRQIKLFEKSLKTLVVYREK